MTEAQRHRGPDGQGLYQDQGAVLGHRRLAIIDRSHAARQPMSPGRCRACEETGTVVWITYNGEIYNFKALRAALQQSGHDFHSGSDTEVILHGYQAWGIDALLARLRGMFAFALYETTRAPHDASETKTSPRGATRLILARDRMGIKPLYYVIDQAEVLFASEVRALTASQRFPVATNHEALIRFLQLGSIPVPLTTCTRVQALTAGHYLMVDPQGTREQAYWEVNNLRQAAGAGINRQTGSSVEEAVGTVRKILDETIQGHLISDVPMGAFLSGGIDSSALVGLAARQGPQRVTTLSVIFEEAEFAETAYARQVAEHWKTVHHESLVESHRFVDELPRVLQAMDQPTVDGVNTYWVAKAAREVGLTVVLAGTGGDEVFLGYGHLQRAPEWERMLRQWKRLPAWVRTSLVGLAARAGGWIGKSGMEKLTYLRDPDSHDLYWLHRGLFTPSYVQALLAGGQAMNRQWTPTVGAGGATKTGREGPNGSGPLLETLTALEFTHYLQNQLLKDTDSMSMAHSVETRVPLLDHHLVEYVLPLPAWMKRDKHMNKPLLVKALGPDLPREVWDRPKMGFAFPMAAWLHRHRADLEPLSLKAGGLDRRAVHDVWEGFAQGRLHWSRPWALVVANHFFS